MTKPTYWNNTISTGPDSSMAGIMGDSEAINKLAKIYAALIESIKDACTSLTEKEKEKLFKDIDSESWKTTIGTGRQGDVNIHGLMFGSENRRDDIVKFLDIATDTLADNVQENPPVTNTAKDTVLNPQTGYGSYAPDGSGTIDDDSKTEKPANSIDVSLKESVQSKSIEIKSKPVETKPGPVEIKSKPVEIGSKSVEIKSDGTDTKPKPSVSISTSKQTAIDTNSKSKTESVSKQPRKKIVQL